MPFRGSLSHFEYLRNLFNRNHLSLHSHSIWSSSTHRTTKIIVHLVINVQKNNRLYLCSMDTWNRTLYNLYTFSFTTKKQVFNTQRKIRSSLIRHILYTFIYINLFIKIQVHKKEQVLSNCLVLYCFPRTKIAQNSLSLVAMCFYLLQTAT